MWDAANLRAVPTALAPPAEPHAGPAGSLRLAASTITPLSTESADSAARPFRMDSPSLKSLAEVADQAGQAGKAGAAAERPLSGASAEGGASRKPALRKRTLRLTAIQPEGDSPQVGRCSCGFAFLAEQILIFSCLRQP